MGSKGAEPWTNDGFFQRSRTAELAVDLLSDPALMSDFTMIVEAAGITSGPAWELGVGSLLSLNGEEHRRSRSVIAGFLTPRKVASERDGIRAASDRLAAEFVRGAGTGGSSDDLISRFAQPYVVETTCAYVGLPVPEVERVWSAIQGLAAASKELPGSGPAFADALIALADGARAALAHAGPDATKLIPAVRAAVDEGSLEESVAVSLVATVFSAGHEPTINQLGLIVELLADHPDVWDGIADGTVPVSGVVEEGLRLRSTNTGVIRRVGCPTHHHGRDLAEGELVIVGFDEANRDPQRFEDPDAFRADRTDGRGHVSFGIGPHHCAGAALARLQLQEGIGALAARITDLRVVASSGDHGTGLRGMSRLDLAFTPR